MSTVILQAWTYAGEAARQAALTWAAASGRCKGALTYSAYHVLTTCGGYQDDAPTQFTPGFGPFALAWGWCLVGVVLGVLLGLHFWDFLARLEHFAQRLERIRRVAAAVPQLYGAPPGLMAMPPWHSAVQNALLMAHGPQRVVLQRLLDDGEPALDFLAAVAGVPRRNALARLLGEQLVQAQAAAWGL